MKKKILSMWEVHYRPNNVSQPWSILESCDTRLNAIIKAYQVSGEFFMVKVLDPKGCSIWSD